MDLRSRDLADLGAPFTRHSFVAAGGAPRTLDRWLSRGLIRPILYGVYVLAEVPDNLPLRAKAVSLVLPAGAAVARTTAAWLYGVDVRKPGQHTTVPEVECVVPAGCTPIRRPGLRCFTADLADDLTCVEGLPCTSAPRTAADLLRWQPPFMGLGAVDAMAHGGIVTVEEVAAALAPLAGHRNVASARQLLAWCEPLTESFGESWLRLRILQAGFPRPEAQVWVPDQDGVPVYRLDLGYRAWRIGIEYDGEEFHSREQDRLWDEWRRDQLSALSWTVIGVGRGEVLGTSPRLELAVGELLSLTPRLPRRPW
jgi:AbiEi antitoxin C-terminal domain